MKQYPLIEIGDQALQQLVHFCRERNLNKFMLVADENTWGVLGERVDHLLREQGWDVKTAMLTGENIDSDERSFMQVFLAGDQLERTYLAVGSGVITDTTRFTSKVTRNQFISLPTAPSVDAYAPINAALTINGVKGSVLCHAPQAIFVDLDTICQAPKRMAASGFSDLVSKLAATADWRINSLLWHAHFDGEIYERAMDAAQSMVDVHEGIARGDRESMRKFIACQLESGKCMIDYGDSTPVAGAEHQIEHLWGMLWYHQNRHGLMHGESVGVGVVITSRWYEQLRAINKQEAEKRLADLKIQSRLEQENELRRQLGPLAEAAIQSNPILFQMSDPQQFNKIRGQILENWDEIQNIARLVPSSQQFVDWMQKVGAPTLPQEIGISEHEVMLAKEYAHSYRDRFSIAVLRKLLGIE